MSSLGRFSILTYLIILFLSVQSCDLFVDIFTCEDTVGINTLIVREYITDSTFTDITPLRNYPFGNNEELSGIGDFKYTFDKKIAFQGTSTINYGSDLSVYEQEFKIASNPTPNNTDCIKFADFTNVNSNRFMCWGSVTNDSLAPLDPDTISLYSEILFQYEKGASDIDTLFNTEYTFIDSATFIYNSVFNAEYDMNGIPLIQSVTRTKNFSENEYGVRSFDQENIKVHLIRAYSKSNYDTLYTYTPDPSIQKYDQFYFTSSNAGIFINLHDDVFLLRNDKTLKLLYSGAEDAWLPTISNIAGNMIYSEDGKQFYDLTREKHIDLSESFDFVKRGWFLSGQLSNNGLIALLIDNTNTLANNRAKIFIYNTYTESISDSVSIKDLPYVDEITDPENMSVFLISPVFTTDNRLVFMYVFNTHDDKCINFDDN